MSSGKIVQIIGAVIDVEFPRDQIPKVYEALKLADVDLTLEVQQQLGDGVVRTIAMGVSEGLKRGLKVNATGAPISVPGRRISSPSRTSCPALRKLFPGPAAFSARTPRPSRRCSRPSRPRPRPRG